MSRKAKIDREKLIELREMGYTLDEIAKQFAISKSCLCSYIKKYGLELDTQQRRNLIQRGIIKKYGVENVSKISEVRERAKKTWQLRTGLENPYLDPEMVEKRKQTCRDRYGCDYALQNSEVRNKIAITNRIKYGGNTPASCASVRDKASQTYKIKTGYDNPSYNPVVLEKRKTTFQNRYGAPTFAQRNFTEKAKSVLFSKETFEDYLNTCGLNTTKDISRDLGVSDSTIVKTAAKYGLKGYAIINTSKGEQELREFICSLGVKTIHAKCTIIPHMELDIYCPDYNIAIEYNGVYWHSDLVQVDKLYHYKKSKACEERGIRLIHVYEDEWNDPIKREIIKSLIKIALGKAENKIYARNCVVKSLTNVEARPFNELNHIQGHRNAQITYGLFYEGMLVQLMSFSWNNHYQCWEIIRGCPGSNNIVVGGVSKLFKYFILHHNPQKVFSYCDYNKFNGSGYEAIGMQYIGETKCNKWYVFNNVRYERNPRKYHEYNENKDCIVWGAGSKKYMWENPMYSNQNND